MPINKFDNTKAYNNFLKAVKANPKLIFKKLESKKGSSMNSTEIGTTLYKMKAKELNIKKNHFEKINNNKKLAPIQKAKLEIKKYMYDNRKHTITPNELGSILLDNYHFIEIKSNTQNGNSMLGMYIFNKTDPRYGTYTINTSDIQEKISVIAPKFRLRNEKDLFNFIKPRSRTIFPNTIQNFVKERLIPVKNGIFNLKNHKLIPFSPKYVFFSKINTNYPKKPHKIHIKNWSIHKFMMNLANNDTKRCKLLWQIANSIFTQKQIDKLILLLGTYHGSNGKSTFEQMFENIIGFPNFATIKITNFGKRFALSELPGTFVDIGDDVDSHENISSSAISVMKRLVSNDTVNIEAKNKPQYSFVYTGNIIQSSNSMLYFKDNGGVKRRLLIVKFKHEFKGNDNVKTNILDQTDVKENFLYYALNVKPFNNFIQLDDSPRLLNTVMESSNPLLDFVQHNLLPLRNEVKRIPVINIYHLYKAWAILNGHSSDISSRRFTQKISEILKGKYTKKRVRLSSHDCEEWSKLVNKTDVLNSKSSANKDYDWTLTPNKEATCFVSIDDDRRSNN